MPTLFWKSHPGQGDYEAIRLTIPTARLIVDGIDRVPSWERIVRGLGSLASASAILGGNVESMRLLDTPSLEPAMLRHPKSIKELCEASDMPIAV